MKITECITTAITEKRLLLFLLCFRNNQFKRFKTLCIWASAQQSLKDCISDRWKLISVYAATVINDQSLQHKKFICKISL